MAWGSLSASQWVSFTDAQGAGFLLKSGQNQTTSIQWMTKSDAIAKYQINESKASLVAKASNQWVEKQDLESGVTIYSFTIYTSASHPGSYGWYTANEACTGTRVYPLTVYSSSSSLIVGSALYFLSGGVYYPLQVNLFVGQTELWLYNGTSAEPFRLTSDSSNVIAQVGTCIACKEYYNYTGGTLFGINGNDCNGNTFTGVSVDPGQSICAQEGSLYGGDSGFLTDIGNC